jgi:hypothetical protein
MSLFTALALATPLFGFSLTPPSVAPLDHAALRAPVFAQVQGAAPSAGSAGSPSSSADPAEEPAASNPVMAPAEAASATSTPAGDYSQIGEQIRQRQELGTMHRAFGIATWSSMLATVVLGLIQYHNMYGGFGGLEDTPCVRGEAIFGQDQCWGTPWAHRIAAITSTTLYSATFALSFALPDPLGADQGESAFANNLRIHKALRWAHLGGMIAQVLLGLAVGQNWFGLDRANDFGALQAIAAVHNSIGLVTFGLVTAAGAVMVF